ncbi:MAG TPA: hypothetical protein VGO64_01320 [Candidatus Limnocylindrales bacterium]|nr:hypothetical protein [Candidatus Limnocylindrales bacterium]
MAAVALLAGCGSVQPPSTNPDDPGLESDEAPSGVTVTVPPNQMLGEWTAAPLPLADSQIAIISDACATAARQTLGEAEANLPTAVVDARGSGLVLAVLSDDDLAILCLGHVDAATGPTVDSIDRLAAGSFDRPDGDNDASATEVTPDDAGGGQRTVAFGRLGVLAANAEVGLRDGSAVQASASNGWWAAWWRGPTPAAEVRTQDEARKPLLATDVPAGIVENRLGPAEWWLDPKAPKPLADTTTLDVIAVEKSCSGGQPGKARLDPPRMDFSDTSIVITLGIRRLPGAQDCPGNAPFPVKVDLPEQVDGRALLDGGVLPPRDATKPPPS